MRRIHQLARPQNDQAYPNIILASFGAEIPDRTAYLLGKHSLNPAIPMIEVIKALASCGSVVVGIPCNTAHSREIWSVLNEGIEPINPRPKLVNMIHASLQQIRDAQHRRRVGVLATTGSVTCDVFGSYARSLGLEAVYPESEHQQRLHDAIYAPGYGIKSTGEAYACVAIDRCRSVAQSLVPNVDALLIGCTELSLIPRETFDDLAVPVLHSLDVLAEQLLLGL